MVESTSQAATSCDWMRETRASDLKAGDSSSFRIAAMAPSISWTQSLSQSSWTWWMVMKSGSSGASLSGFWAESSRSSPR